MGSPHSTYVGEGEFGWARSGTRGRRRGETRGDRVSRRESRDISAGGALGIRGARTSETSTTQVWLARCSGGMYDSTHSLTCLIAALKKREGEARLVSRVSVGRIAVRGGEDLRKLDARVPEARRAKGSGPESLTLFFFSASASALLGSLKGPAIILHGRCFTRRAREWPRGRRRRRKEKFTTPQDHSRKKLP